MLAEEVHVRYGLRVQFDVLRLDTGTGSSSAGQIRAVHVVKRGQSTSPKQRIVRVVAGLAMVRGRDQRGRDDYLPNDSRFWRRVHRLGWHQRQVTESERPTQSPQV